jgi:hypothetical protein
MNIFYGQKKWKEIIWLGFASYSFNEQITKNLYIINFFT